MSQPTELPPKPEVALALLQTAISVYVHLDPRPLDVRVPVWLKKQPQLVLQVGLNMAVAIPDLDVGEDALSCTLSFNRRPEFCRIPWTAIYGLVGEDGRGMIWPDSIPPEVALAAEGRGAAKKDAPKADGAKKEASGGDEKKGAARKGAAPRARLRAVAGPDEAKTTDDAVRAEAHASGSGDESSDASGSSEATRADTSTEAERDASPKKERPAYLRLVK